MVDWRRLARSRPLPARTAGGAGRLLLSLAAGLAGVACAAAGGGPGGGGAGGGPGGKADFGYEPDPDFDYSTCPGGEPVLVDGRGGTRGPAAWTVVHYAAGDNDLEPSLIEDVNEMEHALQRSDGGRTPNVHVVTQLDLASEDGSWRYYVQPGPRLEEPSRTELASDLIAEGPEIDSADPAELEEFGRWAVHCFPAEKYVVLLGGHGNGWSAAPGSADDGERRATDMSLRARAQQRHAKTATRRGGAPRGELPPSRRPDGPERNETVRLIAADYSSGARMSVEGLAGALRSIRRATIRCGETPRGHECENADFVNRLVAYGSDACLMGTIEVANDLEDTAIYFIGSEETEPAAGWPYNTVVRDLADRPFVYAQRPHLYIEEITNAYTRSYESGRTVDPDDHVTLAMVDTAGLRTARNRLHDIADVLTELLTDQSEAETGRPGVSRTVSEVVAHYVWRARDRAYGFGDGYTDLGLLLRTLRDDMIEADLMPEPGEHWTDRDERFRALRDAIDDLLRDWDALVPHSSVGPAFPGAEGLSIYLPRDECGFGQKVSEYERSSFAQQTGWHRVADALMRTRSDGDWEYDYTESFGKGTMHFGIDIDGRPVASDGSGSDAHRFHAFVECEASKGNLFVYAEGYDGCVPVRIGGESQCIYPPDLSFDVDLDDRTVSDYRVFSRPGALDIDAERYDVGVPVMVEGWAEDEHYAGSFSLRVDGAAGGEAISVDVEFSCSDFRVQGYCEDKW